MKNKIPNLKQQRKMKWYGEKIISMNVKSLRKKMNYEIANINMDTKLMISNYEKTIRTRYKENLWYHQKGKTNCRIF